MKRKTWRDHLTEDTAESKDSVALDRHVQFIIDDVERLDLIATAERIAARHYTSLFELLGPSHRQPQAHARAVLWAIARKEHNLSYSELGRIFRRDHTTIADGIRQVSPEEIVEAAEKGPKEAA